SGLLHTCPQGGSEPMPEEVIAELHDRAVIARAKQVSAQGGGFLDADTIVSRQSFFVAQEAAGACVAAVDAVMQDKGKMALFLVRPPGPHATPERTLDFR